MIASQFNLDHRLAELRRAGVDHRQRARTSAGQPGGGTGRGLVESLRALLGGSPAGRPTPGLAAR
jgi:hypothetical protein